jgi:methylated-DNA-[protein]-cysteine S-methyltransferase
VFETAIGACAIGWTDLGVCGFSLPSFSADQTRASITRKHVLAVEGVPDAATSDIIARVRRLLGGEAVDLSDAALDESGVAEFDRRVYALTRAIPPGRTRSYGELARELGDVTLSQRVGQSLGRNPIPVITPCHRVVAAGGDLRGFSAPGGIAMKKRLLLIERALPDEPLDLFD